MALQEKMTLSVLIMQCQQRASLQWNSAHTGMPFVLCALSCVHHRAKCRSLVSWPAVCRPPCASIGGICKSHANMCPVEVQEVRSVEVHVTDMLSQEHGAVAEPKYASTGLCPLESLGHWGA
jgi:hypothetical protein